MRLLPVLSALYTFALVDRTNLGSARIAGLDEATDLNVGNRVSITSEIHLAASGFLSRMLIIDQVLVFYVGYIIFEIPSNMALKKLGPANWLAALGASWGLVTLGIGFSKNWQTVAVCRVLLGIFEAVRTDAADLGSIGAIAPDQI